MGQTNTASELAQIASKTALQTTDALNAVRNRVARDHGAAAAVTVAVDAGLAAAVAVLRTAIHAGSIHPCDAAEIVRTRLDHVLALPNRLHKRRPDGSLDPVGLRMN